MSGGEYEYAYSTVGHFAEDILVTNRYNETTHEYSSVPSDNQELRILISKHLHKVADLMHAIEWYDSGDTGEEDCVKAMQDFLKEINQWAE